MDVMSFINKQWNVTLASLFIPVVHLKNFLSVHKKIFLQLMSWWWNPKTHLLCKSGRMDAVEIFEAVLQPTEPHGVLHHINALQLEVIHRVKGCYAAGVGLSQSQELLCCCGDGLAGRIVPADKIERVKTEREMTCFTLTVLRVSSVFKPTHSHTLTWILAAASCCSYQ